jgi:polyphosphate glucokinase
MQYKQKKRHLDILAIDTGGTRVKIRVNYRDEIRQAPTGPAMMPRDLVERVRALATDWSYDAVSLGYPGEVRSGRPSREPHNLGTGWIGFDFQSAFGRPVKVVNDAAMQALGSYQGGRMLFLGLGTGMGSALVIDKLVQPMELTKLPYKNGQTFGDYVRHSAMERLGIDAWQKEVFNVIEILRNALVADYVVLGGGNARLLTELPPYARRGNNARAFEGAFRLWLDPDVRF